MSGFEVDLRSTRLERHHNTTVLSIRRTAVTRIEAAVVCHGRLVNIDSMAPKQHVLGATEDLLGRIRMSRARRDHRGARTFELNIVQRSQQPEVWGRGMGIIVGALLA